MSVLRSKQSTPEKSSKNILIRYDSGAQNNNVAVRRYSEPRTVLSPSKSNKARELLHKININKRLLKNPSSPIESAQSKVASWLNKCSSTENFHAAHPVQFDTSLEHMFNTYEDGNRQTILQREDFKKSNTNISQSEIKKPTDTLDVKSCVSLPRQSIDSDNSVDSKLQMYKRGTPLSPNSQKKSELYTYLKLMDLKHTEQKNGDILQNRRSNRVKNLMEKSEKKEPAKKSTRGKRSTPDDVSVTIEDAMSKKSFAELNIKLVATKEEKVFNNASLFHPRHIPKAVISRRIDFDSFIMPYVRRTNRFSRSNKENQVRNMRLHKTISEKPSTLRKKMKLIKTPMKRRSERILRSSASKHLRVKRGIDNISLMYSKAKLKLKKKNLRKKEEEKMKITEILNRMSTRLQKLMSTDSKLLNETDCDDPKEDKNQNIKPENKKEVEKASPAAPSSSTTKIIVETEHNYTLCPNDPVINTRTTNNNIANNCKIGNSPISNKSNIIQTLTYEEKAENAAVDDVPTIIKTYSDNNEDLLSITSYEHSNNGKLSKLDDIDADLRNIAEIIGANSLDFISPNSATSGNVNIDDAAKKIADVSPNKTVSTSFSCAPLQLNEVDSIGSDSSFLVLNTPSPIKKDQCYISTEECTIAPSLPEKPCTLKRNCSPGDINDKCKKVKPNGASSFDYLPRSIINDEEVCVSSSNEQIDILPVRKDVVKSLHRNLVQSKKRPRITYFNDEESSSSNAWSAESPKVNRKNSHYINICQEHGDILNSFYYDYNLVITQDLMVTFWTQSALGFMLEAQNMWVPKGSIQRLALENGCVHRKSRESIISMETSFAYVELWTKEHKSDKRERPVADVFAVIYFWRARQAAPDKKFLQLENINGFANDVRYVVLKNSYNILVSWRIVKDDKTVSIIHCYQLSNDYQTVVNIREIESVEHVVSSLHNIEDCDNLVLGCGEQKVTIWNLEFGYIVATIDIFDNLPEPIHLWVKCDRGFLFSLQQFPDGILRLVAINGMNRSWKRLQSYKPPAGYNQLAGVSIENGILICFYNNGMLCYNIQTGDLLMEELSSDSKCIPSGKHVVIFSSKQEVHVRNALSYLITNYDFNET